MQLLSKLHLITWILLFGQSDQYTLEDSFNFATFEGVF